MAKGSENSRSLFRLFFWEGLALAGLLHIHLHPPFADSLLNILFFYNSLFFLVAYPLLYVYRWKMAGGCLGTLMFPISFVLSWFLGASLYIWITYWMLFTGNPYVKALMKHWYVLGPLSAFVYFPLIEPLLGISRRFFTLGQLLKIVFFSSLCGFLSILLAMYVDQKFGESIGANRFLLRLFIILIGTAVGALAARPRGKS